MSATTADARDLLSGNPWAAIWRLTWPLALTMVANALVGLLDIWIAGRVDPTAQAAVRQTIQLMMLINAAITAASIGCQALVSRFVGANDWPRAAKAAQQTLLLGFWVSVVAVGPVWLLAPSFFQAVGAPPDVQAAGSHYLRLVLLGLLPMDLGLLLGAVFRARGRTKAILLANAVENGVWAACSLGLGYFAGWGLGGLAAGFVLGKVAGVVTAWRVFKRTRLAGHMAPEWKLETAWVKRVVDIGLPAGIQVLVRNLGMMGFFGILNRLADPTATVAAFSIGFGIESLAFLPVFALNIAAATLVGQFLGAGKPDEAESNTWRVMAIAVAAMVAMGLAFWLGAEPLARLFTTDATVIRLAVGYLRIAALSEPFLAVTMILNGAFQGAGETKVPMKMTFAAQIMLRLPAAWLFALPLGGGAPGVWWAMTGSLVVQAAGVVWLFRRGTWRDKAV